MRSFQHIGHVFFFRSTASRTVQVTAAEEAASPVGLFQEESQMHLTMHQTGCPEVVEAVTVDPKVAISTATEVTLDPNIMISEICGTP